MVSTMLYQIFIAFMLNICIVLADPQSLQLERAEALNGAGSAVQGSNADSRRILQFYMDAYYTSVSEQLVKEEELNLYGGDRGLVLSVYLLGDKSYLHGSESDNVTYVDEVQRLAHRLKDPKRSWVNQLLSFAADYSRRFIKWIVSFGES